MRYNGEWLAKLSYADVVRLARTITVARILERDDFAKRMKAQEPISISELLYPLMQAYDSVAIEADVELGGTDQLYNLLAGREVMPHYGLEPQVVLTTPLLLSWDGEQDELVAGQQHPAHRAARGDVRPDDADLGRPARASGTASSSSSRCRTATRSKRSSRSRASIVARSSWGEDGARAAEEHFTRVVREGGAPEDVPEFACPTAIRCTCRRCSSTRWASALDLRGAAADRAGRRQAGRRRRSPSSTVARSARRRAAPGREAPFRSVDTLGRGAILLRPSERAA